MDDHNISILNCTQVPSDKISSVIQMLDSSPVNYTNLDVINFGYQVLKQKDFIIFGKWLLNQFSKNKDNNDFKLANYL